VCVRCETSYQEPLAPFFFISYYLFLYGSVDIRLPTAKIGMMSSQTADSVIEASGKVLTGDATSPEVPPPIKKDPQSLVTVQELIDDLAWLRIARPPQPLSPELEAWVCSLRDSLTKLH